MPTSQREPPSSPTSSDSKWLPTPTTSPTRWLSREWTGPCSWLLIDLITESAWEQTSLQIDRSQCCGKHHWLLFLCIAHGRQCAIYLVSFPFPRTKLHSPLSCRVFFLNVYSSSTRGIWLKRSFPKVPHQRFNHVILSIND